MMRIQGEDYKQRGSYDGRDYRQQFDFFAGGQQPEVLDAVFEIVQSPDGAVFESGRVYRFKRVEDAVDQARFCGFGVAAEIEGRFPEKGGVVRVGDKIESA